uniref:ATP synthase complex subunit 8 n=1 Tax=Propsilocerus taihuensis TaxID=2789523 RepID=A0A8K1KVX0_9DIPT|nr:ATP synthase F0 subunit 8 [Propsilocerus taihuensis]UDE16194.1 ATP synthase F0 subunit 8 [Propsilocerus taihuensis]
MPQMAPISWLILLIFFIFILILFNILNYYCFFIKSSSQISEKKIFNNKIDLNWKW